MWSSRSQWWIIVSSIFWLILTGCATPLHAPQWFFAKVAEQLPDHTLVQYSQLLDTYPHFEQTQVLESNFLVNPELFGFALSGSNQLLWDAYITVASKWEQNMMQHDILLQAHIDGIVELRDTVSIDISIELTLLETPTADYLLIEWLDLKQTGKTVDSLDIWKMVLETQIGKWLTRSEIEQARYLSPYRLFGRLQQDSKKTHMLPDPNDTSTRFAMSEWDTIAIEDTIQNNMDDISLSLIPEKIQAHIQMLSDGVYSINVKLSREYAASFDGQWTIDTTNTSSQTRLIWQLRFAAGVEANLEYKKDRSGRTQAMDVLQLPDYFVSWDKVFE